MMRHEFLPAIGPYITDKGPWRHPIHWLDPENASIFYPRFLGSYALWRDAKFPHDRGELELGCGTFYRDKELKVEPVIFGDSGGYTLVTQDAVEIDPVEVITWQLKYCTRGVILDVPPYRPNSAIQFRGAAGEYWEESIKLTTRNVERTKDIYLEFRHDELYTPVFSWWGVVQGETREQMEEWHGKISELYPFKEKGEGWALAPKPSTDLLSCARYMRFAHDKGLKRVHLLQVTAEKTVGVVLALAALGGSFDLVTYDSASALRCAINRSAIISDGIGMSYIKEARKTDIGDFCSDCGGTGWTCSCHSNENAVQKMMETCFCQACQWFREDFPLSNREYPHYILLHNHLAMVASCEQIYQAAIAEPDRVLRWACGDSYGDVLREWDKSKAALPKSQTRVVRMSERI